MTPDDEVMMQSLSELVELREFVSRELPDGWIDTAERGDHQRLHQMVREVGIRTIIAKLGAAGWVAPHWPVEHGGRGLGEVEARTIIAQLDEWGVPRIPRGAGFVLAAPAIRSFASEATKARFLPPIVTGEEQWCQLFSEPGAGSDLASLACTAVRDGDDWIVTGQKVWTTLALDSQFGMLLARTDPTVPKHKGITYFGLDLRSPGVEVRPLVQMTGETEFCEVFIDEARIPDVHRISPVGEGWAASTVTLHSERVTLSSGGTSKQRSTSGVLGGKTIDDVMDFARAAGPWDDVIRQQLTQAYIESKVLSWTTARGSAKGAGAVGSVTKLAKAKTNQQLQVLALSMLGARATAWDESDTDTPGFVRGFLRTRANSIEGGTSEIQRNILGERVLGLPREPDAYAGLPWNQVPRS